MKPNQGPKLGVSPLSWTNDVLEDLGGDITVEQCLQEAAAAGYQGVELGRKFPRSVAQLQPLLQQAGLCLASGWYSGVLASGSVAEEIHKVVEHASLLQALGSRVMVYGECSNMPLDVGMSHSPRLAAQELKAYGKRMTEFAGALFDCYGLKLAYHHHLMTVVEQPEEIDAFFDNTGDEVGMLLDSGHAIAAGVSLTHIIKRYGRRICHIHLKDVRAEVMRQVREQDMSFNSGVRKGMFTVPGDGCVDCQAIVKFVQNTGYDGWLVVEAEQDPQCAPPLATVTRAREQVAQLFDLALTH